MRAAQREGAVTGIRTTHWRDQTELDGAFLGPLEGTGGDGLKLNQSGSDAKSSSAQLDRHLPAPLLQ
ncbi:hypothetical protein NK6_7800 [Bradyrhizobium diazoefficiens]|uniref:Uncharacterized protein n=1 Tax=Bradyrhizobium diazoefficiens TaxID=1355477 RepID=A0A0E4BVH8_9BRAD|nr:hypothetical protein NK6_7800 [Bradyrhizobium diazoefficiens]